MIDLLVLAFFVPFTPVIAVIVLFVFLRKLVEILKNSKHEYAIMSRYKLLLLYGYTIVVASVSLSYIIIFLISFMDSDHTIEAFLWQWISLSLFLAIVILPALLGLIRSYIKPNFFFIMDTLEEINPKQKTRLYIVKVTLDRELILSNRQTIDDRRGFKIFKPVSYVMNKKIHMESKDRKSRYKPPTIDELS